MAMLVNKVENSFHLMSLFQVHLCREMASQFGARCVVCCSREPNRARYMRQLSLGLYTIKWRTYATLRLNIHNHRSCSQFVSIRSKNSKRSRTIGVIENICLPRSWNSQNGFSSSSACSGNSSDNDSSRSKFSNVTINDESDVTVTKSEPTKRDFVNDLADSLLVRRERWALAKAITLAESTNLVKRKEAQRLMSMTLEHLKTTESHKNFKSSFRIGLTGPPGAGKSTFIEAFGKMLTKSGQQVAVLAVDPSSSVSGGSLLGDKTRMPELSRDPKAYIRASPSSGTLGGVTRTTNETILLCEGAGFDIILVETVGVGQSEYVVADMVDVLVLIIPPAGGDELQGIKRGIVERTDIVLVNKADGELKIPARRVRGEYTSAIKIMRQRSKVWKPKVLEVSSKEGSNLDKTWDLLQEFKSTMITHGLFQAKRRQQQRVWMWSHIQDRMLEAFREDTHISNDIQLWERRVLAGTVTPGMAADVLLEKYLPKGKHKHESKFVKSRWMDR